MDSGLAGMQMAEMYEAACIIVGVVSCVLLFCVCTAHMCGAKKCRRRK